jgi:PadR family transcriptional regulator, regulatory protein PadR
VWSVYAHRDSAPAGITGSTAGGCDVGGPGRRCPGRERTPLTADPTLIPCDPTPIPRDPTLIRSGLHCRQYGFELIRTLSESGGLLVSEGTIYPLLSRLRRDDLVTTSWQESEAGPPRRYYQLTSGGERALAQFTAEWATHRFRDAVDSLLTHGEGDEQRAH